jgi:hypothetical protein
LRRAINSNSAREMLAARIAHTAPPAATSSGAGAAPAQDPAEDLPGHDGAKAATGGIAAIGGFLNSREGKHSPPVTRGLFGMLKK